MSANCIGDGGVLVCIGYMKGMSHDIRNLLLRGSLGLRYLSIFVGEGVSLVALYQGAGVYDTS